MDLPLPLVVELAPGADPDGAPSDWHFVSEGPVAPIRRRKAADIVITSGRDDESDATTPGSCELTFDDRAAHMSPRNVLGQWYGQIDKNTPMRVRIGTGYDRFDRTVSGGWGTSTSGGTYIHDGGGTFSADGVKGIATHATNNLFDTAILSDAAGDNVQMIHSTSVPVAPTGGAWVDATLFRFSDNDNLYRLHTEFQPDGTIRVKIVRTLDGANTELVALTDTGITYVANDVIWTHAEADGPDLRIKCWADGDDVPTTWHATARDYNLTGHGVGLYEWRLATNLGSFAAYIHGVEMSGLLSTTQVPEWPVRWPGKTRADAEVAVAGAGLLRRLEADTSDVRSPLDMQLSAQNPAGYWRLEDASGATQGASAVSGGRPARINDASFGGDDTLPGASTSLVLNTAGTSTVSGQVVVGPSTATGYNTLGFFKFETIPAGDRVMAVWTATGTVYRWVITANAGGFIITGFDVNGTAIVGPTGTQAYSIDPTNWFALAVETVEDGGGDVDWAVQWHEIGTTLFFAPFGSYTGTADRLTGFQWFAVTDNMSVAHSWLGENTLPFVNANFRKVANGFIDEEAAERLERIFGELNLSFARTPGASTPMGRQKPAKRIDTIRNAESADSGLLYESGAGGGYIPLSARYNAPVTMELDWLQGHLDDSPEPTDDDQGLANQWIVSREDGASSTPVQNAESVARFGVYPDAATINIASDEELVQHAGWKAWEHSGLLLRWPRITLNLLRNRDLIPQWLSCGIGSRFTIANVPGQLAGEVIDLMITGYQQQLNTHKWIVELSCEPAAKYAVGVWGTSRRDARTTTLDEDLDTSETSVSIKTELERETWETAGGYVVTVSPSLTHAGEDMSVTSATSPSFSGGYYRQVLTVVRGAGPGGIVKAHADGDEVHVRVQDRPRWARV